MTIEAKTGNEEANIEKAAELGTITEDKKEELLGGLSMGFGEEATKEEEVVEEPAVAAKAEEEILIGGKTFTNEADAIAYARELEQERLASDAYRQGVQDAAIQTKGNPSDAAQGEKEDFNEKFYENPQDFIAQAVKKAADDGYQRAITEVDQRSQKENLWNEFYSQNPELKSKDKLVQTILQDNWDVLGHMKDHKAAMKILAKKTKDTIRAWIDEDKPKETLANTQIGASPGSQSQVTLKKTEEKPLDFISQIRKAQEERMA
jgi:hypothetical protein